MANQYKNKVIYNGTTLMDISDTTAIASDVGLGKEFYTASGAKAQGTAVTGNAISVVDTTDTNGGTIRTITAVDISDTTAVAADVASGKYFYTAQGIKTLGTASGGDGVSWTTLFDQTVQVYEDEQPPNYCFFSRGNDTIAVGDVYRVTFNGVTSTLTAKTANNRIVIGNPGIINSSLDDSSGLTYCIYDNDDTYKLLLTSESENQYSLKVEKQVQSGGSSGQTATGTVTGSDTTTLEIPCSFEPDVIYVYGDMSEDASNRGIISITIIKDTAIYMTSDGSQSAVQENGYAIHDITGYNESNTSEIHATYANNVLTIDTAENTSSMRFLSGLSYTYELSTLGTGGGGSSATLITKTIDANGTYSAQNDSADGYSSVTVSVPSSGITPTGSINIATNGTHDVTNYASAIVSVPTSGGGGSSGTQHTILFEFEDETTTTITAYYDSTFISSAITATTPTTYDSKTVTRAQLDGVTWYEVSGDIPLNTELVDYNAVRAGYIVGDSGAIEAGEAWECVTDYLPIDSSMIFTFKMLDWYTLGLYDANKNVVQVYESHDIADSTGNNTATGTLNSSRIPSTAKYVVLTGNPYNLSSNTLSLIRTA